MKTHTNTEHTYQQTHMHLYMHRHTYTHAQVPTEIHSYTCTRVHMLMHMNTHANTYQQTDMHTQRHTQRQRDTRSPCAQPTPASYPLALGNSRQDTRSGVNSMAFSQNGGWVGGWGTHFTMGIFTIKTATRSGKRSFDPESNQLRAPSTVLSASHVSRPAGSRAGACPPATHAHVRVPAATGSVGANDRRIGSHTLSSNILLGANGSMRTKMQPGLSDDHLKAPWSAAF